jgi:hypothetical protein
VATLCSCTEIPQPTWGGWTLARARYREGDWFAVPLTDGGFGTGLVARSSGRGVLLGYFFGPRHGQLPSLQQVRGLTPKDAVLVGKFGHLGLTRGTWPMLGRFEAWNRTDWPMPILIRYEELTGRSYRVFYDDGDPNRVVRREQTAPGTAEHGPTDGLMGVGYVEELLTDALS